MGNILINRRVFHRFSHLIPPLIINFFANSFQGYQVWIKRGVYVYLIIVVLFIIDAFLNAVNDIYKTHEISKSRPIKGFLQAVKIAAYIIGCIAAISFLLGENPIILLGGVGALTAIITLVFKDSILGFVAGIQLTSDDLVRIGDWIELPKYSVDGTVIEISLNVVKIENFDKTITTIPAYALISESFRNWRGMEIAGGRRIKRAIYIDINSIKFCTGEMLEKFKKIEYIKNYITDKQKEIDEYNKSKNIDLMEVANGRRLTNIGTFRIYILNYLKNHPGIRKDMILNVRQLESDSKGMPLEIYAFANDIKWINYENIQADIFDHLLAVAQQFELRIFQEPTGNDMRGLLNK
jgi:miniconductance mechanosensitive channel